VKGIRICTVSKNLAYLHENWAFSRTESSLESLYAKQL